MRRAHEAGKDARKSGMSPLEIERMMAPWRQGRGRGLEARIRIGQDLIGRQVDSVLGIGVIFGGLPMYGAWRRRAWAMSRAG